MDRDLMDGLTQEQFERVRAAERVVTDARRFGTPKSLVEAQRFLANVQLEVWQETKSNA